MKKIVSIVLALTMALSLCVTTTWAVDADTTWYNDTDSAFTLTDAADLLGLAKLVNDGTADFSGKTVKLGADIDLAGIEWIPIGGLDADKEFKGTFDGDNKTISNLTMNLTSSARAGLFSSLKGTIKNVKLQTVNITSSASVNAGGLVCVANTSSTLENCHVKDITINVTNNGSNNSYIGGLAGRVWDDCKVSDCTVTNFNVTTQNNVFTLGGLIGWFYISGVGSDNTVLGELKNCKVNGFTANVAGLAGRDTTKGWTNFGGIGGMLGYGHSGQDKLQLPVDDCHVTGANITVGYMYKGSFVGGFLGMSRRRYVANNCSAQGTITVNSADTAGDCYVGGFCGAPTGADINNMNGWPTAEPAVTFTNCTANVNISAPGCTTGGFAGLVGGMNVNGEKTNNTAKFDNCTANGTINGAAGATGGFTGNDMGRGTYTGDCKASGATNNDEPLNFVGTGTPKETPNMVKLTFNLNGGTGTMFIIETPQSIVDLTDYTPTREGYNFVGWADADGTMLEETSLYLVSDTTLDAVWEEIPAEPAHSHTRRQPTTTTEVAPDTTKTDVVTSAKTFDAGIAVYAAMGILSLTGSAWVVGKKRG